MATWGDEPARQHAADLPKPDRAEGLITLGCLFVWVILLLWYLIIWTMGG